MVKKNKKLQFKNPVIAAQVLESPFVPDSYLGHTMPPGKDFIGDSDFVSFDQIVSIMNSSKKKLVLNIGDSSTSGWDSNIVTKNRLRLTNSEPLLPAFFQYKTYSDFLRQILGKEYFVVNAGVPAHTSLQGLRRLRLLLNKLASHNIVVDWVTSYFGNNDSVWDHNREDKDWVGKRASFLRDCFASFFSKKQSKIVSRVSEQDYKKNLKDIVRLCESYATSLIFIEPLTPLYWKPGTRVLGEDLQRNKYPGSDVVYQLLDEGRLLWAHAIAEESFSPLKLSALEEVREKDYIVPRIKSGHLRSLHDVVLDCEVPFVQVKLDRSVDDIRYFIDYCHPIDGANEFIAEGVAKIILGKGSGHPEPLNLHGISHPKSVKAPQDIKIPTQHYTLY